MERRVVRRMVLTTVMDGRGSRGALGRKSM